MYARFRPQLHCCSTRCTMAGTDSSRQPKLLSVFQKLSIALSNHDQCFCLKPKQVLCFESLIDGSDVIAVLPTGYGKSLLFQFLPDILPTKTTSNVVLVVTPLNSIIEDQLMVCKFSVFSQ